LSPPPSPPAEISNRCVFHDVELVRVKAVLEAPALWGSMAREGGTTSRGVCVWMVPLHTGRCGLLASPTAWLKNPPGDAAHSVHGAPELHHGASAEYGRRAGVGVVFVVLWFVVVCPPRRRSVLNGSSLRWAEVATTQLHIADENSNNVSLSVPKGPISHSDAQETAIPTPHHLMLSAASFDAILRWNRHYDRGARRIRRLTDARLGCQNVLTTPQVAPSILLKY